VPASPPPDTVGDGPSDHPELDHLAAGLAGQVISGPVRDVVEAVLSLSVSARVLWGNVASAVNGAASMFAATRPARVRRARALTSLLLDQPPLRHTSTLSHDGTFRRRSCCLIYRADPHASGPVCGDCVLATRRR